MGRLSNSFVLAIFFIFSFTKVVDATFFLSADSDLRYRSMDDEFKVEALGLSLRKVVSDKKGDRFVFFTLLEAMHNFEEVMLDQAYLMYKGPLGKWNITAGRYRLPFGLLPNYSTERLLIKTLEHKTIGIESDNGLLLSGVLKDYDYAFSISQGVGTEKWRDIDNNKLFTFRIGCEGDDFEDLRVGFSGLLGEVMYEHNKEILYKKLLAVDMIKYAGQAVLRSEISFGEEENKGLLGLFSGIDYAIFPKAELNIGYSYLNKEHNSHVNAVSMGLTYTLFGFQIRIAQKLSFTKEERDEFSFQVYRIFNYSF